MKDFGDPLSNRSVTDAGECTTELLVPSETQKTHLFLDIIERVGRVNRKADQNDVRIRVGERAQAVIVFLTCRIPKSEFDMFAINIDIGDVVLEDSGNIDLVKGGKGGTCKPSENTRNVGNKGRGSIKS